MGSRYDFSFIKMGLQKVAGNVILYKDEAAIKKYERKYRMKRLNTSFSFRLYNGAGFIQVFPLLGDLYFFKKKIIRGQK